MNANKKNSGFDRLIIPLVLALCVVSLILDPAKQAGSSSSQSYSYDDAGRLTAVTYGDGRTISYSYDANGNLLSTELSKKDEIFFDGFEQVAFLSMFRRGK